MSDLASSDPPNPLEQLRTLREYVFALDRYCFEPGRVPNPVGGDRNRSYAGPQEYSPAPHNRQHAIHRLVEQCQDVRRALQKTRPDLNWPEPPQMPRELREFPPNDGGNWLAFRTAVERLMEWADACWQIVQTPAPDELTRRGAGAGSDHGAAGTGEGDADDHDHGQGGHEEEANAGGGQDKEQAKALSQLQYDILDALRCLKATDPDKRVTGQDVAIRVGGEATEQSVKAPLAALKRQGLVGSKTGRGGGTWLTPVGLDFINSLRQKQ